MGAKRALKGEADLERNEGLSGKIGQPTKKIGQPSRALNRAHMGPYREGPMGRAL